MLITITKHYRLYLEGGVVLFLLPSSLHTVAHQLDESTQARLIEDQTPAGTEALPEVPPCRPILTETIHLDAPPPAPKKTANFSS